MFVKIKTCCIKAFLWWPMRANLDFKKNLNPNCEIKQNLSFKIKDNLIVKIKQNPNFKESKSQLVVALEGQSQFQKETKSEFPNYTEPKESRISLSKKQTESKFEKKITISVST